MKKKWRRFEVLLPRQFNDGRNVPRKLLSQAVAEVIDQFGAASYETQVVHGFWRHRGIDYQDKLARLVVDLADTPPNRTWMKKFKARWKRRLQQIELWVVSYPIDVE